MAPERVKCTISNEIMHSVKGATGLNEFPKWPGWRWAVPLGRGRGGAKALSPKGIVVNVTSVYAVCVLVCALCALYIPLHGELLEAPSADVLTSNKVL